MKLNTLTATALAAALMVSGTGRATADIGDAIAGGIIGGVIVGAIQHNRTRTQPVRTHRPRVPSAARQQARDVQTALNHFQFHVGVADGVLGRQSRAGISQYQAYLSFPVTGHLSEFERQVLLSAHQRAVMGGPHVTRVAASHPNGMRGLLDTVRDEMLGINQQPVTVATPAPPAVPAPPVVPAATAVPAAPEAPAATSAVPNFFGGQSGGAVQQASLASHCNRVSLVTNANGGYAELGTLSDPVFALNEQFCLARGYAIAEGEALVAQVPGATAQSIAAQCQGLEPLLQPHVAALSVQPRDQVLQGVTQFVLTSGMSTSDLASTARICLSSGYLTEDLTVAVGSAMVLVALGEHSYGELPAHHLMQGIGATQRRELAAEWFRASLPAGGVVSTEVAFRPGPDSRNALILAAVDGATGDAPMATTPVAPVIAPQTAPQPYSK
ncbi:peptidoglycan-binding domain-containing protein [Pararhodobacter oceanensis]|uniref:peptidoglycan-binding domain-containing protein n=1 Tax=Pararhodobacter oceanensis TaxID=2172121 RepID=UPI003A8DAAD2